MQINLKPSKNDNRDFKCENIMFRKGRFNFNLPEIYDLSKYLLPIRDQGNQNSCVAMTAACIKEFQEYFDSLQKKKLYFSPQFIYNNRKNQKTEGMTIRDLLKILQKKGCCLESTYSYGNIESPKKIPYYVYEEASKHKIKNYFRIDTIIGLKNALINYGPCLIAFPVYNNKKYFWKKENNKKILSGHALTVVGYNKKGFILRNSWGEEWGDNGYTIYPYSHFGSHWEIWTTQDIKTQNIKEKKKSIGCIKYLINFLIKKIKCIF